MGTQIDHLVIGATTLEQGIAAVNDWLGVNMPYGGSHEKMGTHNCLMRLGDGIFLEIIALSTSPGSLEQPRWFGLDDPYVRYRIAIQPTLLGWVVHTDNLSNLIAGARCSMGQIEHITRGKLHWLFSLPEDGRLLAGGLFPYAIEWQTDSHPSTMMADLGCHLLTLDLYHNQPTWLHTTLGAIDAADLVTIHGLPHNTPPYFQATINTPFGPKKLSNQLPIFS